MAGAKDSMADNHDHISSSSSGLLHGPQKDMRSGSIPHPLLPSPHPLHASAQKVENEQGKGSRLSPSQGRENMGAQHDRWGAGRGLGLKA